MALAYAVRRTISSSSSLLSKVCNVTNNCSFTCSSALSKKLTIAEELDLPEPPSKPHQPFVKFMSMGHKELTNLTWSERVQKLSIAWNNQTQEEKSRRLEQYYEEKKEYQLKYREYLSQLSPEQIESIRQVQERRKQSKETALAKKEKKKELEKLGKPKVPENCFIVFANKLQRPIEMTWRDFLVHAAKKWKALPEGERDRYKDASRAKTAKYEADMAEWEKKMLAAGRSELVRRRTYQVYQTSDNEGQFSSRHSDHHTRSSKQETTSVRRASVNSAEESDHGRTLGRAVNSLPEGGDWHSTPPPDTTFLKHRIDTTETRDNRDESSKGQRMVCEEFFLHPPTDRSTKDSALLRRPYQGSTVPPRGYVTHGTRRPTQQRNAMFAAALPDD